MKIDIAKNSGFCMGVRNAVLRIVKEINTGNEKINVFGPLIHNPQTIDVLSRRGLETIDNLNDIDKKTIAIRTHGVPCGSLSEIRDRASRCINLTCPRVARVQGIIKKYSQDGYFTIITGDKDHAEVIGLKSYAASGSYIITDIRDIKGIPNAGKYILVSQTTFDGTLFEKIESILREKIPDIIVFNTICDSTHKRQGDVINAIQRGIDALVVVGGRNSANTRRLAQFGTDHGIKTLYIETETDLETIDFDNVTRVLITAGASTPGWIINNVLERLYDIKFKKGDLFVNLLKRILEFTARTNLFSAVASFFVTSFAQQYMGKAVDYGLSSITFLYVIAISTLNNYFQIDFLKTTNPYKFSLYQRYKIFFIPLALISFLLSFIITLNYDPVIIFLYLTAALFESLYSYKRLKGILKGSRSNISKKLYGAQIFISSFMWLIVSTALPLIHYRAEFIVSLPLLLFLYSLIYMRIILLDIICYQGDIILGKERFPIKNGIKLTKIISLSVSIISIAVFVISSLIQSNYINVLFSFTILYYTILLFLLTRLNYLIALKYEFLVDLNLLFFIGLYFIMEMI